MEVQAKIRHLEDMIPNVKLDRDCNAEDCRQTLVMNNKLAQVCPATLIYHLCPNTCSLMCV